VVEAASGHARALRQIRMLARSLVVEALEQHRDDAAQVRDDVLDVREAPGTRRAIRCTTIAASSNEAPTETVKP
ncbi:MAG: hypothetical protein ACRELZ_25125, partial [Candidatus Rokuibacteriota bacterium]